MEQPFSTACGLSMDAGGLHECNLGYWVSLLNELYTHPVALPLHDVIDRDRSQREQTLHLFLQNSLFKDVSYEKFAFSFRVETFCKITQKFSVHLFLPTIFSAMSLRGTRSIGTFLLTQIAERQQSQRRTGE